MENWPDFTKVRGGRLHQQGSPLSSTERGISRQLKGITVTLSLLSPLFLSNPRIAVKPPEGLAYS